MTALTKLYNANLDIIDANIQDVSGDVTKSTYIRIPITLPASGQIMLSLGAWESEVEQPSPYIDSAILRGLEVLVAGNNRDRAKSVPFTFQNLLFGGNSQVNNVIVWAGRNAANELLLAFEIEGATAVGSGSAASYQDIRNVDPNPLVVNHLAFSPEDSFRLPTTDNSAAIVDTDLLPMFPASDAPGQTRVNPVMQSWADLKSNVGAGGGAEVAANTSAIATNKGNIDTNTTNIATNTTSIATNTAGVAANLATLNALPDYGPPGLVADFTVTQWDYLDSNDGVPPGSEYYRWNGAPNPTGAVASGGDFTFTPKATALTINEVQWRTNSLRFFGESGTNDTWGPDVRSNTALSLYVYYQGLPNADPRVVEVELASATDFDWGASAKGAQWAHVSEPLAPLPGGFVEGTAVRFMVANKGEAHLISVFVGAADTATNKADIAANTAAIATNTTGIATNLASINALPDFGVENIVADWTITSWASQGSGNSRAFRWNAAPSAMGAIAAGGDLTFTPASRALTINRMEWYPDDSTATDRFPQLFIYGASATDSAWGTEIIGNSELSLYAYLQGLPNAPKKIHEAPLDVGKTFNWGTGNAATGVIWDHLLSDEVNYGITAAATAVRFIIADRGQGARIAVWLGIANGIPEIVPVTTYVAPTFFLNATRDIWYDTGVALPADSGAQLYELFVSSGAAAPAARIQVASKIVSRSVINQTVRLPSNVVSGTTTFDSDVHSALYLPVNDLPSGFYVSRANTGDNLWLAATQLNDSPARVRFAIYGVGQAAMVP